MKKKAVIYARFSSHQQTEQSIEGQLRECYDYAKRNDYIVIAEYIDRALTGTSDKRPEFLKMIDDSKKKNFNYILVYQLDRFARNRFDSATYKAKLKKNDVRVISARENITDDASGVLVEGVLESMAEYYSAELSQKVKRGMKETLLKGRFTGGYGILGYDIIDKCWTINPIEAEIVRDIFTRYKNGEKAKSIADRLTAKGIKTKAGAIFNVNNISRIIRNNKYTGKISAGGTEYNDIIPAIIDEKLFNECNSMMDTHKHRPRENKTEKPYILSGKLFCGYCNSQMTAETGTSHNGQIYHYYKCFGKKKNKHTCSKKNFKQVELEDLVFSQTVKYVLQPKIMEQIAKMVVAKFNSEIKRSTALDNFERELKQTDKAINSIMTAIENGIYTKTTKERLLALEAQKEVLEQNIIVEKSKQVKPLEVDSIKRFLNYYARKDYETKYVKNDFFNSFINRVVLFDDKIYIFYNTNIENPTELSIKKHKELISEIEKVNKTKNSLELKKFKRESSGCGEGI